MDLSILERTVGSLHFKTPLIIGAGTCKTLGDVKKAVTTDAGGIEIGSITPKAKAGNPGGKTFYAHFYCGHLLYTLNSLGLPNPGKEQVSLWTHEAIERAHDNGMLIGVNVAADSVQELIEMVLWAIKMGFDWVTVNGGCPNKYDEAGKPMSVLSNDLEEVKCLFDGLDAYALQSDCQIWWKGSPTTDTVGHLPKLTGLVANAKSITVDLASNTVPHCFARDESGERAIGPGNGLAGMGGPAVKPIAEGHIRIKKPLLRSDQYIVASGGVQCGDDLADYLRQGAVMAQVTSAIWAGNMNYGEVNRILAEFVELPNCEAILAA